MALVDMVAWWRRLALKDHSPRQACCKTHSLSPSRSRHARQDTSCGSHPFGPTVDRPRRLTVGSGTREDYDAVQVRDLRRTRRVRGDPGDAWRSRTMTLFRLETFGVPGEYVAFQAVFTALFRSFCASGGVHRASSCRDCSVCARELQVHNFAEQRVLNTLADNIVDSASGPISARSWIGLWRSPVLS